MKFDAIKDQLSSVRGQEIGGYAGHTYTHAIDNTVDAIIDVLSKGDGIPEGGLTGVFLRGIVKALEDSIAIIKKEGGE